MQTLQRLRRLVGVVMATSVLAGLATTAQTQTVLTTYSAPDIFIGFRQTGVANTLVANLGSATKFLSPALGGTAVPGTSSNVQFGVIPNTPTPVTNLFNDLNAVFGSDWSDNFNDGSGVKWGLIGSSGEVNDTISGLNARSIFTSRVRSNPNTQTSLTNLGGNRTAFSGDFNSFAEGIGGGRYINQNSTVNSSVAFIGSGSAENNWNTRIGSNGSFGQGSGRSIEQARFGTFQGTTDSAVDFWLLPQTGSTIVTTSTYLGYFTLNTQGQLNFTAVPEPSTLAFTLGTGLLFLGRRRRNRK